MADAMENFYERLDRHYSQDGMEAVERFLLEYANASAKSGEPERMRMAAYNELGSLYRGAGKYSKSLWAFEQAKLLATENALEGSIQYATILNNMAGTYRLMKEPTQAIALFLEAIDLYRRGGMGESDFFASALNNLSLAYREIGENDLAIPCLEQALAIMERLPERRGEIAVTYHNLAILYRTSGKAEPAALYLHRALQAFENCPIAERIHYAAALNSLACHLYAAGDFQQALAAYRKSAYYTNYFFGENEEYGITWQNMALVYEKTGANVNAILALEKAEQVYRQLLGADHRRTRAVKGDLKRLREGNA